ncbi:MAG TPA: AAA family ATPase [Planctomycetota bacterium]|nr:AAA family ATPase [Planctomycetota bacterium]
MSARRFGLAGAIEPPTHVWLTRLANVASRAVDWLWPSRVPLGKVTLLVGDPGRGKSLLALDMAARVTRGAAWPDAASGAAPLGGVVLLSGEDDAADTIRPRLEAMGGDAERVTLLRAIRKGDSADDLLFSLARDLEALEAAVQRCGGVRLVVLDPVSAYLTGTDAHSNEGLRAVLAPLRTLAERSGVAVVAISHFTKRAGAAVIYRAMGSMAFVAAARAVWAVGPDRGAAGRLLFLPVKCNLAGGVTGMAYRVVPSPQDARVPVVAWEPEPVELTAAEALEEAGVALGRREQAAAWLEELLADGPLPSLEVERRAREAGLARRTLMRAKGDAGAVAFRQSRQGAWLWGLAAARPDAAGSVSQDAKPLAPAGLAL